MIIAIIILRTDLCGANYGPRRHEEKLNEKLYHNHHALIEELSNSLTTLTATCARKWDNQFV